MNNRIVVNLLLILAAFANCPAQSADPSFARILLRSRADVYDALAVNDAGKLGDFEKAIVYARLGAVWSKFDRTRSATLFEKSVDIFFFASDAEKKAGFGASASTVLTVIGDLDARQSERLVKLLSGAETRPDGDQDANADALVELAIKAASTDPARAARFGELALKIGRPRLIHRLVWKLRGENQPLAEDLSRKLFAAARLRRDYVSLQTLLYAVLPESQSAADVGRTLQPTALKLETIDFLDDHLAAKRAAVLAGQASGCLDEALLLRGLTAVLAAFRPSRVPAFAQTLDACLAAAAPLTDAVRSLDVAKTVDELLALADRNKDDKLARNLYLSRAAVLANNARDHAAVLMICDRLTADDIAGDEKFWDAVRFEAAGNLAFSNYLANDLPAAQKVLGQQPTDLVPFAEVVFLRLVAPGDVARDAFVQSVLDDARRRFPKSGKPFASKIEYWLPLVRTSHISGRDIEAVEVFDDIRKEANLAVAGIDGSPPILDVAAVASAVPAELLGAQEFAIKAVAAKFDSPAARINIYLALLQTTLEQTLVTRVPKARDRK